MVFNERQQIKYWEIFEATVSFLNKTTSIRFNDDSQKGTHWQDMAELEFNPGWL